MLSEFCKQRNYKFQLQISSQILPWLDIQGPHTRTKHAPTDPGQYPTILTTQTWPIKPSLTKLWPKGQFFGGILRATLNRQDTGSLLAQMGSNCKAQFGSPCCLAEPALIYVNVYSLHLVVLIFYASDEGY